LSFISLIYCKSQVLVSESKLWSTVEYGTEQPDHQNYHSYWIKFAGDSTIHDTIYKKTFRSDDSLHTIWISYGFMREDSSKKVYARNIPKVNNYALGEELIYDFNLKKGDTINMLFGFYIPVDSVGYISLENKICKTIYISYVKWIEGIGSNEGILHGLNDLLYTGQDNSLVCYSENDTVLYNDPNYNSCFVNHIYTGIQLPSYQKLSFHLTKDNNDVFLIFSGEIPSDIKLSIYDVTGKRLYSGNYNITRINLSELNFRSGFYVYEAVVANQRYCGKVILY
jgi:hypothetical protein